MNPPFAHLSTASRRRFAAFLAVGTVAVAAPIAAADAHLRTDEVPLGIVQFELAGDAMAVSRILGSWSESPERGLYAAFSLGIDYLFLVLYGSLLALACAGVAERLAPRSAGARAVGVALAWGQLLAAACDGVENAALFHLLLRGAAEPAVHVAFACATAKFGLLGAGLAYLLVGYPLGRRGAAPPPKAPAATAA